MCKLVRSIFNLGKWNHDDLGSEAAEGQYELAGRAAREGEPPRRTQTPCSLALTFRCLSAQVAMVAPTFTGNGKAADEKHMCLNLLAAGCREPEVCRRYVAGNAKRYTCQ